ncbi:DUF4976 domain-containing protein [Vibrio hannami]|nr:sulfatase/phosphatase domain-containing protein [Vibrio hannami]MDG3085300.1 DUF4976 domain-containing protein [Vibrio hannami]
MAGVPLAKDLQGKSLVGLMEGKAEEHKDLIITEHFEPFGAREVSVRDVRYRYYCDSKGKELLFDLEQDPDELSSVHDKNSYQDVLSNMRFKMLKKIQQVAYPNVEKVFAY